MGLIYAKGRTTLHYKEEKPVLWKAKQLIFPKVKVKTLIQEISDSQGIPKTQTQAVIEALLNRLVFLMSMGHLVSLGNFGSFKPVFNSKLAHTKEDIETISGVLKVKKILFFPGGAFRRMLKELEIESTDQAFLNEQDDSGG